MSALLPNGSAEPKPFPVGLVSWGVAFTLSLALLLGIVQQSGNAGMTVVRVFAQATSSMLPRDENGHTNVLLLGIGDKNHAAANLTDSIIVASISQADRSVVLLSIPRDLYIEDADDVPAGRINTLYAVYRKQLVTQASATGAHASTLAMRRTADDIAQRLGMQIHGVLKIDFTGFEEIVDAVGGVDIDVPEDLRDYEYPLEEGVIGTFELQKGLQHMDGQTALRYARTRHSTSDFSRSDRQQQLLKALGDKVSSLPLFGDGGETALGVASSVQEHFETTFRRSELLSLAGTLASVDPDRILNMQLNYGIGSDGSDAVAGGFVRSPAEGTFTGAVLFPLSVRGDISDWSQIRSFAQTIVTKRELYFRNPLIELRSAGSRGIEIRRLRNEILRYGFSVAYPPTQRSVRDELQSEISVVYADSPADTLFFSQLLRLPVSEARITKASATGASIHILLGTTYVFRAFQ